MANAANTAAPGSIASLLSGSGTASPGSTNIVGQEGTGGWLGSLFGGVPGVSNPTGSASEAIKGNLGNLTEIANLAQGVDTISNAAAPLGLESNLPGYESMLGTASANTQQELSGQLPQDVVNQITQEAAERGVATGQGAGSPNTNAAMLSALGLTSLGEEQTGASNLSTLIGETPQGAQFNPASMFVTPEEQQAADQAALDAEAAPDPALSGAFSSIMSMI